MKEYQIMQRLELFLPLLKAGEELQQRVLCSSIYDGEKFYFRNATDPYAWQVLGELLEEGYICGKHRHLDYIIDALPDNHNNWATDQFLSVRLTEKGKDLCKRIVDCLEIKK